MLRYINLDNYIKDVIVSCIDRTGYIEAGHLRYIVDLHLAADPDNLIFEPCDIREGILILTFRQKGSEFIEHKSYSIEAIIDDYLKREMVVSTK